MNIYGVGSSHSVTTTLDNSPQRIDDVPWNSGHPDLDGRDELPQYHVGKGSEWVPQGLGYHEASDTLFNTYSSDAGAGVLLSIVDRNIIKKCDPTQRSEYSVKLGGTDMEDPEADAPGKGGGVAADDDFVYVADGGSVYVYDRRMIENAKGEVDKSNEMPFPGKQDSTPTVNAINKIDIGDGFTASYLTVHDNHLYVGDFTVDRWKTPGTGYPTRDAELRQYEITPSNKWNEGGSFDPDDYEKIDAPHYAQGAVVTDKGVLFATSLGANDVGSPRDLVFQPTQSGFKSDGPNQVIAELDYMAEGITIVDGRLWVAHESGADKYREEEKHESIQSYSFGAMPVQREDLGVPDEPY